MKVLALDYGSAHTGVAVSDETGTVARPLCVVDRVRKPENLRRIVSLAAEHGVERIVVGLPLTPSGARGGQAAETEVFVSELRSITELPIDMFDERFTTRLATRRDGNPGGAPEDAVAAAFLLTDFLTWTSNRG